MVASESESGGVTAHTACGAAGVEAAVTCLLEVFLRWQGVVRRLRRCGMRNVSEKREQALGGCVRVLVVLCQSKMVSGSV